MSVELELPPDLDHGELVVSLEKSLARVRARIEALSSLADEVRKQRDAARPLQQRLEGLLAAVTGEPVTRPTAETANGSAPSPQAPKAPAATAEQTAAEDLLRRCGGRAYDYALQWAREKQEFALDDIEPQEGITLPQARTALRALLADGALAIIEDDRVRFMREPNVLSLRQQILDYLAKNGSTTQRALMAVFGIDQTTASRNVRNLVSEGMVTNLPAPDGKGKVVTLVGTSDGGA